MTALHSQIMDQTLIILASVIGSIFPLTCLSITKHFKGKIVYNTIASDTFKQDRLLLVIFLDLCSI